MGAAFYIAQGISVLTCIVAILMMQWKTMTKILMGQIAANLLTASTYFLLGGFSGAGICLIAILQSVVMFCYSLKKIPPHRWVIGVFLALYGACSAVCYRSPGAILSALAAICIAMSVVQTKPSLSRLWYVFNPLFWLCYDILTCAVGNFVLHLVVFVATLFAIFRNDLPGKKEK